MNSHAMYWHYFKRHNSYQVEIIIIMTIIIINIVSDCGHRVGFLHFSVSQDKKDCSNMRPVTVNLLVQL